MDCAITRAGPHNERLGVRNARQSGGDATPTPATAAALPPTLLWELGTGLSRGLDRGNSEGTSGKQVANYAQTATKRENPPAPRS